MRVQKYKVVLSAKQRKRLKALSQRGQVSARKLARAHILLLADQNRPQGVMNDNQIHILPEFWLKTYRWIPACTSHCLSLQYSPRRTEPMVSEVASRPISGVRCS